MNTNYLLNPDHNIWNNNGTWWCHFTIHNPDYTKERVRVSLHTKDRNEARQRRDFIMRGTTAIAGTIPRSRGQAMPDAVLSSQRFAGALGNYTTNESTPRPDLEICRGE